MRDVTPKSILVGFGVDISVQVGWETNSELAQ